MTSEEMIDCFDPSDWKHLEEERKGALEKKGKKKGKFGSRNVGGRKPTQHHIYNSIESEDYTEPDTVEVAMRSREFERPDKRFPCSKRCQARSGTGRRVMP